MEKYEDEISQVVPLVNGAHVFVHPDCGYGSYMVSKIPTKIKGKVTIYEVEDNMAK